MGFDLAAAGLDCRGMASAGVVDRADCGDIAPVYRVDQFCKCRLGAYAGRGLGWGCYAVVCDNQASGGRGSHVGCVAAPGPIWRADRVYAGQRAAAPVLVARYEPGHGADDVAVQRQPDAVFTAAGDRRCCADAVV